MPFIVYLAILMAAVFSIGLEWDALVEPSAATRHEIRAVTELGSPPRPAAPASGAAAPAVQAAVPAAAPAVAAAPRRRQRCRKPTAGRGGRDANAGTAAMRHRRLHRRLPLVPRLGLHLSAQRGSAPALHQGRGCRYRCARRAPRGWRRIAISAAAPKPTVRSIRAIAPTSRSRARGGSARNRYCRPREGGDPVPTNNSVITGSSACADDDTQDSGSVAQ